MKKEIKETAKKQGFQVVKYASYSCSLSFSHEAICTLCLVFFWCIGLYPSHPT